MLELALPTASTSRCGIARLGLVSVYDGRGLICQLVDLAHRVRRGGEELAAQDLVDGRTIEVTVC